MIILTVSLNFLMAWIVPDYYDKVRIAIPKIPCFLIGMYFGYLAYHKRNVPLVDIAVPLLFIPLFGYLRKWGDMYTDYYEMFRRIFFILFLAWLFEIAHNFKFMESVKPFCRFFGKYIYFRNIYIANVAYSDLSGICLLSSICGSVCFDMFDSIVSTRKKII